MPLPITEKLILRQINHWNSLRDILQEPPSISTTGRKPVITVSRLAGSGGRFLAEELCARLGLQLHDQSMVQEIVKKRKLDKNMISELDENTISQTRLWVKGVLNQKIFMKDQYHYDLLRVVGNLASQGGVVFLGRAANLILGKRADLRIRVVAEERMRISQLRQRLELSRAEAQYLVEKTDAKRSDFVHQMFRKDPGQPENFDLILNASRLSVESMVTLVLQALLELDVLVENKSKTSTG